MPSSTHLPAMQTLLMRKGDLHVATRMCLVHMCVHEHTMHVGMHVCMHVFICMSVCMDILSVCMFAGVVEDAMDTVRADKHNVIFRFFTSLQ